MDLSTFLDKPRSTHHQFYSVWVDLITTSLFSTLESWLIGITKWPNNSAFVKYCNLPTLPVNNSLLCFFMRVCLKMVSTPKPNGFADHYPYEKWLFHWEY